MSVETVKISVVTISFNQATFLEECITSVLMQDYQNIEYIIVDPGSSDGSREIIEKYRNRFARIIYEKDHGPADGLNKGFRLASGEIFYYLNSDDLALPGSFKKVAEFFTARPDVDVIIGNGYEIDYRGARIRQIYSSKWSPYRYACKSAKALQQSTFFRAGAFRRTRGFNVANKTCWDGEILVDMMLAGAKLHRTSSFLGCFRLYPGSISGSRRLEDRYRYDRDKIVTKILQRKPRSWEMVVGQCFRAIEFIKSKVFYPAVFSRHKNT